MEVVIEVPTARPSLLLLNDYCLMEIFEFLDWDDSINLAKTSNRVRFVADRIFKILSKDVRVDVEMMNKGEEYIDHLFQYIGRHVTSLVFDCLRVDNRNLSKILGNISNYCKNLKILKCCRIRKIVCDVGVQPAYSFDNVEQVTLICSDSFTEKFTKSFLESFHRLKSVIIVDCSIESDELKTIFQNNRSIESFHYEFNFNDFDFQLFELIPNVERLALTSYDYLSESDSLLKLNRLTNLRLRSLNINMVGRKLATEADIGELKLEDVDVDFFDTLASFSKLELLVLYGCSPDDMDVTIKNPISWPAQLKKLRLRYFELTKNHFIAMIQQLESIESIDIWKCRIAKDDIQNFNDVAKLSQEICKVIHHRKHRLDVVLPFCVKSPEPPKKYHFESERLRVVHPTGDENNPLGIKVYFPKFYQ